MEITTTRDIARQMLRHRSFSFQEFSQRYADPTKELAFTLREARLQDKKNRQSSIPTQDLELQEEWNERQQEIIDLVTKHYRWAIEKGIAKEQARVVLPEGLTISKMYMHGTIRSWIHYCSLRRGNGTQREHMEIATEIAKCISKIFPSKHFV
jgi:thymidylate synthase (FAD)